MRASFVALILTITPVFAEPALEVTGRFVWDRPEDYFGGWSGIEVADGGATFVAIGDNAQIYEGSFERADGEITDIPKRPIGALEDLDGVPFFKKDQGSDEKVLSDSEGLAVFGAGQFAVSFERVHRINVYGGEVPVEIALPREVNGLGRNGGVEALARDALGRFIAIPEATLRDSLSYPVWRQTTDGWETVTTLKRTQGFRPVGADVGPDGWLYVLERAFRGVGFQSRIRRVSLDPPGTAAVIWVAPMRAFDNLEGLSVWVDDSGQTRLTAISDDNYNWFQKTEIVEFRLTE